MAHLIVGGVLIDNDRILLGHRRAERRYYPDCWDVLGGHIEPGETPEAALVRELRKEAGIEAAVAGSPALHVEDDPLRDDGMILDIWTVTKWRGNPTNLAQDEHDELRWITALPARPAPDSRSQLRSRRCLNCLRMRRPTPVSTARARWSSAQR